MENKSFNATNTQEVGIPVNVPGSAGSVPGVEPTVQFDPFVAPQQPQASVQPQPTTSNPTPATPPPVHKRQMRKFIKRTLMVSAILLLLVAIGISFTLWRDSQGNNLAQQTQQVDPATRFDVLDLPLESLAVQVSGVQGDQTLSINGQLRLNNRLVIAPTLQPTDGIAGQLYYDQNSNVLAYYNGTEFVELPGTETVVQNIQGLSGSITLGGGLAAAGTTLTNTGVLSVQGQTGAVTLTSGGGLAIDGTTLTNTGVLSIGGASGAISVGGGLAIADGTLSNAGVHSVTPGSANLIITDDGTGNLTISDVGGGSGTVQSPGGTAGRIAKFTGAQTIADSLLSESGSLVTVNGDLDVTGALTLGTALSVSNGGTGATSLTNNGVLIGQGAGAVTAVTGAPGECLLATAGAPAFGACTSGSVSSVNGLTGDLTIANATTSGGDTITIQDASTAQKGLAQFNASNFSVTGGVVNAIQNIGTGASPTFNNLTLTNALGISSGGTGLASTPTNGQLLVGNGTGYSLATLTQGTGMIVANGAGSISLATTLGTSIDSSEIDAGTILEVNMAVTNAPTDNYILSFDQATGGFTWVDPATAGGAQVDSLNSLTGALTLQGAAGKVTISDDGTDTITLDLDPNVSLLGQSIGTGEIEDNAVTLGAKTNGNYQAGTTAGNGISVGGSAGEGWSPTVALGTLTADWLQVGAFDVVLDNAGSELRILESAGDTFYGTFDVGDLAADQTYSFVQGGTVVTSGNVNTFATTAVTAGNGLTGGGTTSALTLNIGAGNGVTVNANDITLAVQASKGLEVDTNGLSLIDCANGEILKYNGSNQWACAADNGGGGVGDDISVNGTAATNANFINTAASGTEAAVTWSLDTLTDPDNIAITIGNASATAAGTVTTGAQTFAGAKTFNSQITAGAGVNLGTQTLQGTTAVIDFTNFDVASSGAVTAVGVNAGSGLLQGAGGLSVGGTVTFSGLANGFLEVDAGGVVSVGAITLGADTVGNYIASLGALTGLSTTGNTGEGSTPTLSVLYGSTANTAVQGNTGITLSAGTNLTGGGSITLGAGGSVTLNVADSPTFAGDVVVQGGNATLGSASQGGSLLMHDGDGNTVAFDLPNVTTNYTLTLPTAVGAINQCLKAQNGTGALFWDNCTGGAGGGLSGSGTTNTLAVFTGSSSIGDSSITDDGSTVTINGDVDLEVQGSNLTLGASGPGGRTGTLVLRNSTNTNTVSLQSGATGTSYALTLPTAVGTANQCLKAQNGTGTLFWDNCEGGAGGSSGVTSLNSLTGALTINNASGAGSNITINNAAADGTTKGIAAFNGTNFSASSGVVNTIQNINTAATPQFAGLTLTGNLSLAANTLQGTTAAIDFTNFDVASNGNTTIGGTLGVTGLTTLNGGLTIQAGDTLTFNGDAFTDLTGNGLQVSTGALTLNVEANKGLAVDTNGLSLIDCANGEILKYNGSNQWACAADNGTGAAPTLQEVYDNDTDGGSAIVNLNSTDGAILFRDNATPLTGSLFAVQNSDGSTDYLDVTTSGVTVGTDLSVDGNLTLANALTVANGGTGATSLTSNGVLYGNGTAAIQATAAPTGGQVLLGNGSGVPTFTTMSGDITISATGVTSIGANAVTLGTDTSGNYVSNLGSLTGLSTTGNTGEGSTPTLSVLYGSTASTAVQGNTQITVTPGTNLTGGGTLTLGSGGSLTVNVADSPTFAGDVAVQGGDLTVGAAGTAGLFVLYDGGAGVAAHTGTLQVAGTLGQNTTYTLPDPGAGTATICLSTGNCAGAGGGITGSGTNNTLAKFTGSGTIGNSSIVDDGSTVSIGTLLTPVGMELTGTLELYGGIDSQVSPLAIQGNTEITGTLLATGDITSNTQIRILESVGATFHGILDVGDLSANQTFTLLQGGTVVTSGNVGTFATTGVTAGSGLTGGGSTGAFTVDIGAGNGIQVNANDIEVRYGAFADTAVRGDTALTCPSGTGNLTGGGTAITLGSGGTCAALNTVANPTFATSVTTPLVQNAGLTLAATGANNLLLQTNGSTRLTVASGGGLTASGSLTVQGGSATLGTTSQQGSLVLHDGDGQTATISIGSALAANTNIAIPTGVGTNDTLCLQTLANCGGGAATLQEVYNNSSNGSAPAVIGLQGTQGSILIRDNATPLTDRLFAVQNSTGSTNYLSVDSTGIFVSGNVVTNNASVVGTTFRSSNETSSNSGNVTLQSGNSTSGNSGNVIIDVGTSGASEGSISIGTANASAITIGNATSPVTINSTTSIAANNSTTSDPPFKIIQEGSGDASFELRDTNGKSFFFGMDGSDGGAFKIASSASAATTFDEGFTTTSGGSTSGSNWLWATKVTVGGTGGTVSSISLYTGTADTGAPGGQVALYTHDSTNNLPETLVASSSTQDMTNGWNTFPISASVSASTTYWLAYNYEGNNTRHFPTGATGTRLVAFVGAGATFGSFPANPGNTTDFASDDEISPIYMTIVPSGAVDSFNGTNLLEMNDSGAVTFQNDTDSTAAFRVLNASAIPQFVIDTTNSRVYIGNPAGDTTGALLVLDTKTSAGDPTGVDGGMYYNSNTGRFRCYEAGAWRDCIGDRQEVVTFTSSDTFNRADYPGMRAARVQVQAGGGAGGGAAAVNNQFSSGSGGGGGAYAESLLEFADIPSGDVTVTIGSGGTGVAGTNGGSGGNSSFGSLVIADGGSGGSAMTAGTTAAYINGGPGGNRASSTGEVIRTGDGGTNSIRAGITSGIGGIGGGAFLGGSTLGRDTNGAGTAGVLYGGGGSGARNGSSGSLSAQAGGNGAAGVVIVTLLY